MDGDGRAVGGVAGSDDDTTVLPPVGGDPALVRPYVRVGEPGAPVDEEDEQPEWGGPPSGAEATTLLPPVPPTAAPAAPASPGGAPTGRAQARRTAAAAAAAAPKRGKVLALTGGAVALVLLGTGAALLTRPSGTPAAQAAAPSSEAADSPGAAAAPAQSLSPSASHSPSRTPKPSPTPSHHASPSASATPSPSASTASPSSSPSTQASSAGTLQLGSSGPAVVTLQQDLRQLWIDRRSPSGVYDDRTAQDVTTFQNWYNVQGDPPGVYGPNSQARMAQALSKNGGGNTN